jgi:hypothetical protein
MSKDRLEPEERRPHRLRTILLVVALLETGYAALGLLTPPSRLRASRAGTSPPLEAGKGADVAFLTPETHLGGTCPGILAMR